MAIASGLRARRLRMPSRRIAANTVVGLAVAWGIYQGDHSHSLTPLTADLSGSAVSRTIVVDASTGTLDLAGIDVAPGEVVEFVLEGSAGAPHQFVLTGASGGEGIDTRAGPNGDTIVRVQAPEDGALGFICVVPGHEGLHGSLVVETGS